MKTNKGPKLTPLRRYEMVVRYIPGVISMGTLAKEYGVDLSYVSRLVRQAGGAADRPANPAFFGVVCCQNEHCGRPYLPRCRAQRFCGRRCRQAQWRREKRREGEIDPR